MEIACQILLPDGSELSNRLFSFKAVLLCVDSNLIFSCSPRVLLSLRVFVLPLPCDFVAFNCPIIIVLLHLSFTEGREGSSFAKLPTFLSLFCVTTSFVLLSEFFLFNCLLF